MLVKYMSYFSNLTQPLLPVTTGGELPASSSYLAQAQVCFTLGWRAAKSISGNFRVIIDAYCKTPAAQADGVKYNLGLMTGISFALLAEEYFPEEVNENNGANLFKLVGFVVCMYVSMFLHSAVPRIATAIQTARGHQVPMAFTPKGWDRLFGGGLHVLHYNALVSKIEADLDLLSAFTYILYMLATLPLLPLLSQSISGYKNSFVDKCLTEFRVKFPACATALAPADPMPKWQISALNGANSIAHGVTTGVFSSFVARTLINWLYNAFIPGVIDPTKQQIIQASVFGGVSALSTFVILGGGEAANRGMTQLQATITQIIAMGYIGMNTYGMVRPEQYGNSSQYPAQQVAAEVGTFVVATALATILKKMTLGPWNKIKDFTDETAQTCAERWGINVKCPTYQSLFKWLQLLPVAFIPVVEELLDTCSGAIPTGLGQLSDLPQVV
jgi:hypothetical protein